MGPSTVYDVPLVPGMVVVVPATALLTADVADDAADDIADAAELAAELAVSPALVA
jgi:hypothetical protein